MKSSIRFQFLLCLFLFPLLASSQEGVLDKLVLNGMYGAGGINDFDLRETTNIYRVYYQDEWVTGRLIDNKGVVYDKDLQIKYDILNQRLNISLDNKAFSVPKHRLNGFLLFHTPTGLPVEQLFVCAKTTEPGTIKKFMEIIVKGNYELLVYHNVKVQQPRYIAALDTGNTNPSAIKKDTYYFKDEKGIHPIPRKKKKARKFFQSIPRANSYIKRHKVNFKKQEDLVQLVEFLNQTN